MELHDREKRLLIAQASELQESVQSLQKELGMSQNELKVIIVLVS